MPPLSLQHAQNLRVTQAKVHDGDTRWYIETANGFIVRGPFTQREHAEIARNNYIKHAERELAEERGDAA